MRSFVHVYIFVGFSWTIFWLADSPIKAYLTKTCQRQRKSSAHKRPILFPYRFITIISCSKNCANWPRDRVSCWRQGYSTERHLNNSATAKYAVLHTKSCICYWSQYSWRRWNVGQWACERLCVWWYYMAVRWLPADDLRIGKPRAASERNISADGRTDWLTVWMFTNKSLATELTTATSHADLSHTFSPVNQLSLSLSLSLTHSSCCIAELRWCRFHARQHHWCTS